MKTVSIWSLFYKTFMIIGLTNLIFPVIPSLSRNPFTPAQIISFDEVVIHLLLKIKMPKEYNFYTIYNGKRKRDLIYRSDQ